jgi:hypothetical protein
MGLGSGIRKNLFRIPDPGIKKAPDPDPQHFTVCKTTVAELPVLYIRMST